MRSDFSLRIGLILLLLVGCSDEGNVEIEDAIVDRGGNNLIQYSVSYSELNEEIKGRLNVTKVGRDGEVLSFTDFLDEENGTASIDSLGNTNYTFRINSLHARGVCSII